MGKLLTTFALLLSLSANLWAFSPYSTRELDELEKEFVQQINQSPQILRNPLTNQYINHIGRQLAQAGNMPLPDFFIVKSNEINAFAGPGGHIGINSELILNSSNESELAAVMAHEMAHVRLHHLYRMIEHQKQMRIPMLASVLASLALGVINPTLGSGALMASLSGAAQDSINFTRSNEKEADRIGIDMLKKAGFDPRGMVNFFKKMQQTSRYYYTDNIPAILRTHPLDEDRIAEAENRSMNIRPPLAKQEDDYGYFKELVRNSVASDHKQLLDFYAKQCQKVNRQTACQYGHVLALLNTNQTAKARTVLSPLLTKEPDNLYLASAESDIDIAEHHEQAASNRMAEIYANFPENYAAILFYGDALMAAGKPEKAATIFLQGTRLFKQDLPLCNQLARAQAQAKQLGYAYFTGAQCELLQGLKRGAVKQLEQAKKYAKGDRFLQARIQAKIEEIKG